MKTKAETGVMFPYGQGAEGQPCPKPRETYVEDLPSDGAYSDDMQTWKVFSTKPRKYNLQGFFCLVWFLLCIYFNFMVFGVLTTNTCKGAESPGTGVRNSWELPCCVGN